MSFFNINVPDARVKRWLPKHGKGEDAFRTGELQLQDVRLLPSAAAALLLAKDGGAEVEQAFLAGPDGSQRFWGIGEVVMSKALVKFANRHQMRVDGLDPIRIALIDKLRLRFEGGPQRLIWADFSVHIDDVSDEETAYFHEHVNRDIKLILEQSADLVDEMIASAQNLSVKTTFPPNEELDLGQAHPDIDAAAKAMETGEIPVRGKGGRKPAAKKAAKKKTRARKAA